MCVPNSISSSNYIYYPPVNTHIPFQQSPRFFFKLDGVLANFTTLAASYLDDLQIPHTDSGLFEESMLQKHFVPEVLFDICNGRDFWEQVPVYAWSWLLFERAFQLSKGDVYFMSRAYKEDPLSWGGKSAWVHKNFGVYGLDRTVLSLNFKNLCMLCNGRNDILVTAVWNEVIAWNNAGGSALYFQEIDVRWIGGPVEVAKRLSAMNEVVDKLGKRI